VNNPIATAISQLAELQLLDRIRREKLKAVEDLETEISQLEEQIRVHKDALAVAVTDLQLAEARRRELEATLESEGVKMKDRRMRLNRVRNERELQALRHEIEIGKEANQQVEEEVLSIFEKIDALTASKQSAEEALTKSEGEAAGRIEEGRARIAALRAEIEGARDGRARLASTLDPQLLRRYEQIFEKRAGIAVVEARGGVCTGCHRNLPPQFYNELQRNEDVRTCPSCYRILYWRAESLESSDA
jgi:predicted  nucleic acid-binding Zn-ribbon protein